MNLSIALSTDVVALESLTIDELSDMAKTYNRCVEEAKAQSGQKQ